MKITIDVTQEDIDLGCRLRVKNCMVHRAFMRATEGAFPESYVLPVTGLHLAEDTKGIALPWQVSARIIEWDSGNIIKPFGFEIDLPIEAST